MIINEQPISMSESLSYLKDSEKENKVKNFISGFTNLDAEKGAELRTKLNELNLIKLNDKLVTKIIDVLPENKEELIKISSNTGLSDEESNSILQIVKEYK